MVVSRKKAREVLDRFARPSPGARSSVSMKRKRTIVRERKLNKLENVDAGVVFRR